MADEKQYKPELLSFMSTEDITAKVKLEQDRLSKTAGGTKVSRALAMKSLILKGASAVVAKAAE